MARLTKNEIISLMEDWENEFGEDCIEYVGYGYGKKFTQWLLNAGYTFTGSICVDTLEELSDNIIAYFDVIAAFTDDSEYVELEDVIKWEAFPDYLANHADDDEYLTAVLNFAQKYCDYDGAGFMEEKFEERIGKTLRIF
jgi:hypothetical protein